MSARRGRSATRAVLLAALASVATIASLGAPAGAGAAPPPCPTNLAALEMFAPEYGRAGSGLAVDVNAALDLRPTEATLEVSSASSTTTYPVALTEAITTMVVATGPTFLDFRLTLRWAQEEGAPTACHGEQVLTVPIVPKWATVGDRGLPRLEGRFRVVQRQVKPRRKEVFRPVWRLTPTCDYFSCAAKLRSTGGLKGSFRPYGARRFSLVKLHGPLYTCRGNWISNATGEVVGHYTVHRAYMEENDWELRATKVSPAGRVLRFSGWLRRHLEPKPGRAERLCREYHELIRVSGRRI